jgi:hypothetical protein
MSTEYRQPVFHMVYADRKRENVGRTRATSVKRDQTRHTHWQLDDARPSPTQTVSADVFLHLPVASATVSLLRRISACDLSLDRDRISRSGRSWDSAAIQHAATTHRPSQSLRLRPCLRPSIRGRALRMPTCFAANTKSKGMCSTHSPNPRCHPLSILP